MAVRIRLRRVGSRKNPIWRIVVADKRSPRDGRSIETIGQYNAQTDPSTIVLDEERAKYWLEKGAQPSERVAGPVAERRRRSAGEAFVGSKLGSDQRPRRRKWFRSLAVGRRAPLRARGSTAATSW